MSPFTVYPIAAHAQARLPWELEFRSTGQLFLRSFNCVPSRSAEACAACRSLADHPALFGICTRIEAGAKEGTNWHWLGHSQLAQRLDRVNRENNKLKLSGVNTGRALAARNQALAQHKRFMQIVAEGRALFECPTFTDGAFR